MNFYEWSMRAFLRFKTWRSGEHVGQDTHGNTYYRHRKDKGTRRERRWVVYAGPISDASQVPPEWHAWLHFTTDVLPSDDNRWRRDWQKEHIPNLTGTNAAYRPPGSSQSAGRRDRATGDYEPWMPS